MTYLVTYNFICEGECGMIPYRHVRPYKHVRYAINLVAVLQLDDATNIHVLLQ
jgi:hypothetical protein